MKRRGTRGCSRAIGLDALHGPVVTLHSYGQEFVRHIRVYGKARNREAVTTYELFQVGRKTVQDPFGAFLGRFNEENSKTAIAQTEDMVRCTHVTA